MFSISSLFTHNMNAVESVVQVTKKHITHLSAPPVGHTTKLPRSATRRNTFQWRPRWLSQVENVEQRLFSVTLLTWKGDNQLLIKPHIVYSSLVENWFAGAFYEIVLRKTGVERSLANQLRLNVNLPCWRLVGDKQFRVALPYSTALHVF